jgi:hypothetical protein
VKGRRLSSQQSRQGDSAGVSSSLPCRCGPCDVFPPTTLILSAIDPLLDEGVAVGERLEEAGIHISIIKAEGQMHAFVLLKPLQENPTARAIMDLTAYNLRDVFFQQSASSRVQRLQGTSAHTTCSGQTAVRISVHVDACPCKTLVLRLDVCRYKRGSIETRVSLRLPISWPDQPRFCKYAVLPFSLGYF